MLLLSLLWKSIFVSQRCRTQTGMFVDPEKRWAAVQARDQTAASAFVYAVKTTRIYCRPSCPSRLARRANVEFFDTPAEAVAASYRPCKRCTPDAANTVNRVGQLVDAAKNRIRDQKGKVTLDQLAEHLTISPRYLHHIFTKNTGYTPAAYAAMFKTGSRSASASTRNRKSTSTKASFAADPIICHTRDSRLMPQTSISLDTFYDAWPVLQTQDIFTSALIPDDTSMMWQAFDPGFDLLDQDEICTGTAPGNMFTVPFWDDNILAENCDFVTPAEFQLVATEEAISYQEGVMSTLEEPMI